MFLTVSQRCQFAKIASPLRCNRIAVTVQSRRRYGVIALPLRCNGDGIWLLSQQKRVKMPPTVLRRGRRLPFSRSKCTGFQVLNFGNNILQFHVGASYGLRFSVALVQSAKHLVYALVCFLLMLPHFLLMLQIPQTWYAECP